MVTEIENFLSGAKLRKHNYRGRLPNDKILKIAKDDLFKKGGARQALEEKYHEYG